MLREQMILAAFLSLGLSACGTRTHEKIELEKTAAATTAKVGQTEDACDVLRRDFDLAKVTEESPAQKVEIERTFQRIIRHDCDGSLLSDKVETVQSPHGDFDLKLPQPFAYKGVFVFDRESCEHKLTAMPVRNGFILGSLFSVTGDAKQYIHVKGDLSQATFTFHLNEGRNNIVVRYYQDCVPKSLPGNQHPVNGGECEQSQIFRTRLYPIDVTSGERTLEGTRIIDKTEAECRPKTAAAPDKN